MLLHHRVEKVEIEVEGAAGTEGGANLEVMGKLIRRRNLAPRRMLDLLLTTHPKYKL